MVLNLKMLKIENYFGLFKTVILRATAPPSAPKRGYQSQMLIQAW
jgi:hypothetical protein